jgi:hypothetical protein
MPKEETSAAWQGARRASCGADACVPWCGQPHGRGRGGRRRARVREGRSHGERPPGEAANHSLLPQPVGEELDQRDIHVWVFRGGSGFVVAQRVS